MLALAVMPMQGIAGVLTVLLCHGDAQAHSMHASGAHEHDAEDAGHEHEHQAGGQEDNSTGKFSNHLCCNLTASAPPVVTFTPAPPDFPVQAFAPAPLHDLFIPDRPQRPPLA